MLVVGLVGGLLLGVLAVDVLANRDTGAVANAAIPLPDGAPSSRAVTVAAILDRAPRCQIGKVTFECTSASIAIDFDEILVARGDRIVAIDDDVVRGIDTATLDVAWSIDIAADDWTLAGNMVALQSGPVWEVRDRQTGSHLWDIKADRVTDVRSDDEVSRPSVMFASDARGVSAIDPDDGSTMWRRDGPPVEVHVLPQGRVVLEDGAVSLVVDERTGEVIGGVPLDDRPRVTVGAVGDVLVQVSPSTDRSQSIVARGVDLPTGEVVWVATGLEELRMVGTGLLLIDARAVSVIDVATGDQRWRVERSGLAPAPRFIDVGDGQAWLAMADPFREPHRVPGRRDRTGGVVQVRHGRGRRRRRGRQTCRGHLDRWVVGP